MPCLLNGKELALELGNEPGGIMTLYHVFGRRIYSFPIQKVGRINTIIDLGAHIGLATLYFASLFPDARILSVEPAPENFKLLKKNCETNKIDATLINKCINSDKGFKKFYLSSVCSTWHSLLGVSAQQELQHSIEVEMITIDDLLEENRIEEVDILKVDIEGAEGNLFSNCVSWINKIRFIIMEIHSQFVNPEELIQKIVQYGFHYHKAGSFSQYSDVFIRDENYLT